MFLSQNIILIIQTAADFAEEEVFFSAEIVLLKVFVSQERVWILHTSSLRLLDVNIIFKLKVCKHFYLRITSGFNADGGYYGSLHFNRQIHKGVLWNWECSLLNRTTPPCKNFNFQCYSTSFSC